RTVMGRGRGDRCDGPTRGSAARTGLHCLLAVLVGLLVGPPNVWAYSPESPEVQRLVRRGIEFLEKTGTKESRLGGKALIAMALLKAGRPASHPLVQDAIQAVKQHVAKFRAFSSDEYPSLDNYDTGLAVV